MLSIWLIALHMLGDYILQTPTMAAFKLKDWKVRTIHVGCYTIPFAWFSAVWLQFHTPVAAEYLAPYFTHGVSSNYTCWALFTIGVFTMHWVTDCRRWASPIPWAPKPIMVDQTLHLLQLAAAGLLLA